MIITLRQGIVQQKKTGNNPSFLVLSGQGVNLVASAAQPTIIDLSQGQADYLFQEAANVNQAWPGPFTVSSNAWLFWDINMLTGVRTFGTTPYMPTTGANPPTQSTSNGTTYTALQSGQHWFDTTNFLHKVWNGSVWTVVVRVFAGSIRGGTLIQNGTGSQVGVNNVQIDAGYILYDENDDPIKKYAAFNMGTFLTTTSPLASQFSQIQNYRLETAVQTASASTTIARWKVIAYTGPDQIGLASCNNLTQPAIGIATQPLYTGEVTDFVVGGYITDPLGQFGTILTFTPGQLVFVGPTGNFVTTPPVSGSVQRVGFVVDPNTIYIDIQPQVILSAGTNLIPVQLDLATGKIHGNAIAGGGGGTGTVTSIAATGSTGLTVGGSPITTSGTLTFTLSTELQALSALSTTGFVQRTGPGAYTVTALTSGQITTALGFTPYNATNPAGYTSNTGTVTSVAVTTGTGISVTGSPITTSGTINITNTGVTSAVAGTGINVSGPTGAVTITNTGVTSWGYVGNYRTGQVTITSADVTTALSYTPENVALKGVAGGYASLDGSAKIPQNQLPAIAITETFVVNSQGAMLALTAQTGDIAVRTDTNYTYILTAEPASTLGNWQQLLFPSGGGGTVTAVSTGTGLTGGPITNTGTISLDSASITSLALANTALQPGSAVTSVSGTAGRVSSTGGTTPVIDLVATAVTPGSYTNTNLTVDSFGRITAAANGSVSGTVTSVSVVTANGVSGSVSNPTTTPAITLTLGAITPTSVNASGTITAGGNITGANLSGTNTGNQTITLTGDVTGSGTGTFAATLATVNASVGTFASVTTNGKGLVTAASNLSGDATTSGSVLTLANTGVTPGSYTLANITVDSKGRITAASNGSAGTGTVTSVDVSSTDLAVSGSPITSSGTITVDLNDTAVTPGSYTNADITVDSKGRIIAAANGSGGVSVMGIRHENFGTNIDVYIRAFGPVADIANIAVSFTGGNALAITFVPATVSLISASFHYPINTNATATFTWQYPEISGNTTLATTKIPVALMTYNGAGVGAGTGFTNTISNSSGTVQVLKSGLSTNVEAFWSIQF